MKEPGVIVQHAKPGTTFTTYNFEVSDFHTYFVGEKGVWVHNAAGKSCEIIFNVFESMKARGLTPQQAFKVIEQKLPNMDIDNVLNLSHI